MIIGIIATHAQKEELQTQELPADNLLVWMDKPALLPGASAIIDLLYTVDEYPSAWFETPDILLFINRVENTPGNWPAHFIRFNGWPGFWQRTFVEASCKAPDLQVKAEAIMAVFGKKAEWVSDIPGFLSARVLASIINEAYLSLEEGVSSREDIDTAMKLGTNYPFGPFEWSEKIGKNRIYTLLNEMAESNIRYQPATLLKTEAGH